MDADRAAAPVVNPARRRGPGPALTLFFLAPSVAELLTGSAPPAEFFNPLLFIVLCALYGSGAVLVRELVVRWKKGWPSILLMGMAHGIIEEGLMVKSFFDPHWVDLGAMSVVGRWAGVNVLWALSLTLFHAVWSIGIPILIVELLFPERAGLPWLRSGWLGWLAGLLAVDVAFGFLALTPYRPPIVPYLVAGGIAAALILTARRLPATWGQAAAQVVPEKRHALKAWGAGFTATLAFFFLIWVLPGTGLPAALILALLVLLAVFVTGILVRLISGARWQTERALAAASGALTLFILLAPLQQLDATRTDNTAGMALVGLAGGLCLAWTWRRVTRSSRPAAQTVGESLITS